MNRNALRLSLVGVMVAASASGLLLIGRHTGLQWGERQEMAREQAGKLADLAAENERLSNLTTQPKNSVLSRDQFMELLRLRGEIGLLREAASEASAIGEVNRELLEAVKSRKPPESQSVLAVWPKAQLTPAGYADPVSALQTALWAMTRKDTNALLASVTPEVLRFLGDKYVSGEANARRISSSARDLADAMAPANGFTLFGQQSTSPDQTDLKVYFDGEGATRWFKLKKIKEEWKVQCVCIPGGTNGGSGDTVWGQ